MGKTVKDRTKQKRTYDPDGYRRRADAIIFKDNTFREVLLVSSRSEPDKWTVAGGGVDPNETGMTTAVREAREEAGVVGIVDSFVGSFDDTERKTRTQVYILIAEKMAEDWIDRNEMGRQREWFAMEDAISHTTRRPVKQSYLIAACKLCNLRRQERLAPLSPSSSSSSSNPSSSLHPPPSSSSPPPYTAQKNTATLSLALTFLLICCVGTYLVMF